MLKRKISETAHAALAKDVQALYTKDGDSYILQVEAEVDAEGNPLREKINEFRDNNTQLKTERDALKVDNKKLKKEKTGTEAEKTELEQAVQTLGTEVDAIKAERETAQKRANAATMRDQLRSVGEPMGMDTTGLQDVHRRAVAAGFAVRDGEVVRVDSEDKPIKRDGQPDTLANWMTAGKDGDMALFFRKPAGGGDTPRGGVEFGEGVKVLKNPTMREVAANRDGLTKGTVRIIRE